jgi:hypothetical protein
VTVGVFQWIDNSMKTALKYWRCRGLNPGPFTCKADALPLSYIPTRYNPRILLLLHGQHGGNARLREKFVFHVFVLICFSDIGIISSSENKWHSPITMCMDQGNTKRRSWKLLVLILMLIAEAVDRFDNQSIRTSSVTAAVVLGLRVLFYNLNDNFFTEKCVT